eukprot:TRINITY_DN6100_c0_g3_i1.p1 TRINITY_DN6100_c0_g3~~TRINITY_DN6100_c0_g3_i1.p1  ORF type:complete len:246 (-),score=44.89 TRINITY_DN6100_c0_g3_i1:175-912(-)
MATATRQKLTLPTGRQQATGVDQRRDKWNDATPEAWPGSSPAARRLQVAGCQSPSDAFFNPTSSFMSPMSAYFEGTPSFFNGGTGHAPMTQQPLAQQPPQMSPSQMSQMQQPQQPHPAQTPLQQSQQMALQQHGTAGVVPYVGSSQASPSIPVGMPWSVPAAGPQTISVQVPSPATPGPTLLQSPAPTQKQAQKQPQHKHQSPHSQSNSMASVQQRQQQSGKSASGRPPCPAAVYVDLSSLRVKK